MSLTSPRQQHTSSRQWALTQEQEVQNYDAFLNWFGYNEKIINAITQKTKTSVLAVQLVYNQNQPCKLCLSVAVEDKRRLMFCHFQASRHDFTSALPMISLNVLVDESANTLRSEQEQSAPRTEDVMMESETSVWSASQKKHWPSGGADEAAGFSAVLKICGI